MATVFWQLRATVEIVACHFSQAHFLPRVAVISCYSSSLELQCVWQPQDVCYLLFITVVGQQQAHSLTTCLASETAGWEGLEINRVRVVAVLSSSII